MVGVEGVLCCSVKPQSYTGTASLDVGARAHPSVILSSPEFTVLDPACNLSLLVESLIPVFFPQLQ